MRNKLGPAFVAGVVATSLMGIGGTSALAATSPPHKHACHEVRVRTHEGVHHRRVCVRPKKAPAQQPSYTYPAAPADDMPPAAPVAMPASAPPAYVDDHPAGDDYSAPGDDYGTPGDDSYGDDRNDDHGDDDHGDDDHGDDAYGNQSGASYGSDESSATYGSSQTSTSYGSNQSGGYYGDDRGDDDGDRHGGPGRH